VWVHERQQTGQTMTVIMRAFTDRFGKAPPRKATLLDWEKRVLLQAVSKTGRVVDVRKRERKRVN
jgi:hypothetical protein